MTSHLRICAGQYSDKGRKQLNQDFHGVYVPKEPLLSTKGVAIALADGISSSDVSQVASQAAVRSFLEDYYCTSEAWSVRTSAERVLVATNSWLHAQTQRSQYRFDRDRGYVCTFSGLVIKSNTAHIFHVGDARIYHLRGGELEQLTSDHRIRVGPERSYLGRALGIDSHLEIDYRTAQLEQGDVLLCMTDGVHEYVAPQFMIDTVRRHADDPDAAAMLLAQEAHRRGSGDNLTVQVVHVAALPDPEAGEVYRQLAALPPPPLLEARMDFDGYRIVRELHASSRSHVYLALDNQTGAQVVIKIPSVDLRADPAYLERFLMEEWIARRIDSPYVLKPCAPSRRRNYLYVVTEFIEGRTLAQWMTDNRRPPLETVRAIVEQIARGLRAFHRLEMLHQDLRPENIMIDSTGTVKIIDFGSTRVAGIMEMAHKDAPQPLLGTAQYAAPEYFLGERGSSRSDMFSLAVLTYQLLTGNLPYGTEVAKCRTRNEQRRLRYRTMLGERRELPAWLDDAVAKALHVDPQKRHADLAEFIYDLRHPDPRSTHAARAPLAERNPLVFWKAVSFVLMLAVLALIAAR